MECRTWTQQAKDPGYWKGWGAEKKVNQKSSALCFPLYYIKTMAFLSCRASIFVPKHQFKCSEVMLVKTKLLGK